ncbi:hypothetical protein HG531_002516 [Fusarium graminearum]|nr:hypothetical protein HG531_002516 [Fusarium graminearum]
MSELSSDMLIASTLQQSQSGGGDVKLGNVVLLNNVPVSREVRVGGCTLKDDSGYTEHQGSINDISMTGDPADVTAAEVSIALMDIKDILASHGGTKEISGCHKNILNSRALLESIVDNLLGANQLAASLAFISCDDDLGASIDNTIAQGVRGETSKDN